MQTLKILPESILFLLLQKISGNPLTCSGLREPKDLSLLTEGF